MHILVSTSLYGPLTLPSLPKSPSSRQLDRTVERILGRNITSTGERGDLSSSSNCDGADKQR